MTTIAFAAVFCLAAYLSYKAIITVKPYIGLIAFVITVYAIPLSFVTPEPHFTTHEVRQCSAELEENVLYVRVGGKLYTFDKMSDIEKFKNKKQVVVEISRSMWNTKINSTIVEDFPKE